VGGLSFETRLEARIAWTGVSGDGVAVSIIGSLQTLKREDLQSDRIYDCTLSDARYGMRETGC